MAVSSLLALPLASLRRYAGALGWAPFVRLARSTVLGLLERVEVGQLKVVEQGRETVYGQAAQDAQPQTKLVVHSETFWVRMLLFTDMGFAESFMLEEISCPDLTAFFELFIRNRAALSNGSTLTSSLSSSLSALARGTNTLHNARLNIAAHYDLGNDMFAAFLSPDMTYSCPIWAPASAPNAATETLEEAQNTKLQRVIDQANIQPTDHVLELGTGWGSFAIAAVSKTGCRVTSLTLSREQKALAEQRIAAAGLMDRIEVLLCDYRAVPVPREGLYDKIVSIEMLEAVGKEYLETYFGCLDALLKPDNGIAVLQCITMPETRYDAYATSTDFIRQYIFPGGHLPTVTQLTRAAHAATSSTKPPFKNGGLVLDSLINIGPHYARTLRTWNEDFAANFDEKIAPSLKNSHRGMTDADVRLFQRKWRYYFEYCEAGFRTGTLGDVIVTFGREGAEGLRAGVLL